MLDPDSAMSLPMEVGGKRIALAFRTKSQSEENLVSFVHK
jgi:hypothetical protein